MARQYKLTDDMFVMCENDKDCVFCDHCTDIFWDFSNGIYGICCELNKKPKALSENGLFVLAPEIKTALDIAIKKLNE